MSKLFTTHAFILCIFLLHFVAVANKEQSFLELKEDSEAKNEFALNDKTKTGQLEEFKNGLGLRNGEFTFQSLSEEEDEKKTLRSLGQKKSNNSKNTKTSDRKTLRVLNKGTKALKRKRLVNIITMKKKNKKKK